MDNDRSLSFGAQLRKYRRMAGLTQMALAQQAGVSPRTIGNMERGPLRLYRRDTVALLAEALGLSAAARVTFEEAAFAHDEAVRSAPLRVAHPAALPAQTTSFVGRADLTAAVIALLRQPTIRLVTLTGAPGVGKSRLALVVAAALAAERPNAVAVVALAPIRRPIWLSRPSPPRSASRSNGRGRSWRRWSTTCVPTRCCSFWITSSTWPPPSRS